MNEDGGSIYIFGVFTGIVATVFMYFMIFCPAIHHITHFENKPYCETEVVSGKKFKRCLQAVEVPHEGEN